MEEVLSMIQQFLVEEAKAKTVLTMDSFLSSLSINPQSTVAHRTTGSCNNRSLNLFNTRIAFTRSTTA
jgi:hypothetical protein